MSPPIRLAASIAALGLSFAAHQAAAQSTTVRRPPVIRRGGIRLDTTTIRRMTTPVTVPPQSGQTQTVAPKTISRARLEEVFGKSATAIRVVRASGVTDLAAAANSVGIQPGEFAFRKISDTARRAVLTTPVTKPNPLPTDVPNPAATKTGPTPSKSALPQGAAAFIMPYRWLTVDSAGVERVLVPYFILTSGGLTYDVDSRTYRGVALVGVEDTLHESVGPITLPRPLRLQLTTTSGGSVTPPQLAIGHTSLDYDSVAIESPDSTNVRIRTGADPAGIVIPIPVRSMSVAMIPQQRTLQGLGLATTDITVSLPRGIARRDTATITFSSTGAPVNPSSVRVVGGTTSAIRLRSGLPGADSIRAFLDGVLVGETVVVFVGPWVFLSATIAGIVLGGLARFFSAKRRKKASALTRDILKGSPFGLFAAIAGAIGFDWMHLKLDDPAALPAIVFTAGLGAWLGSRLLDRVAPSEAAPAKAV
ncbi:MAG: hypothetical protein ABJF01_14465 [bacterium]